MTSLTNFNHVTPVSASQNLGTTPQDYSASQNPGTTPPGYWATKNPGTTPHDYSATQNPGTLLKTIQPPKTQV